MSSKEQSIMRSSSSSKLHIAMFPWFAVGHIMPYLHLSNELAERGHKISFLLPNKALLLLEPLNLHPHPLITFLPLSVPHVDGLPLGTETASDVHISLTTLLAVAFDLTRPQVEHIIASIKPSFVFYDFAHWVPEIAAPLRIKSVSYSVISVPALCNITAIGKALDLRPLPTPDADLGILDGSWLCDCPPPLSFTVALRQHEVCGVLNSATTEFGKGGVTLLMRIYLSMKLADAIALRTCTELEGQFRDYLITHFQKPFLLTGSVLLPDIAIDELGEPWESWLQSYAPRSVVYCKLGSQTILEKKQFQEILLGFELTGYPFIAALKPPIGCCTLDEAYPEGFEERVRGRGKVVEGWVSHQELLKHPMVGCYVSHCGYGSMWESLVSGPEIVLMPEMWDQILSTRLLAGEMKVAVEVDKDERGFASRDNLCKAVKEAMNEEALTRKNHAIWREMLTGPGFMSGYIDNFVDHLQRL